MTKTARASRDSLMAHLKTLAKNHPDFPRITGTCIPYGSFARSTKNRPLDDIDLLLLLVGTGTRAEHQSTDEFTYWLKITSSSAPQAAFPDDCGYVNSTKILNKIRSGLADVEKYYRAEIHKNTEAVTLELFSYDWVFDIVPAVPVGPEAGKISYYLIPDGSGDWKRTDPRIDDINVRRCNERHAGTFLPLVRILKCWNKRPVAPALPSYYLETLALRVFENAPPQPRLRDGVEYFFQNCSTYLWGECPDPKRLGPPLDKEVDNATKLKVDAAMKEAATRCGYALMYERSNDHKTAIYWWREVFGDEYPNYG